MTDVQHIVAEPQSQSRHVPRNRSLLLNDAASIWLLEAGAGVVFAATLENGRPVGSRRSLFRASQGDLLGALPGDDGTGKSLMLFVTSDVQVCEMSVAQVAEACRDGDAEMCGAMEHWLCRLADVLADQPPPAAAERLDGQSELVLEDQQTLRMAKDGMCWFAVDHGSVQVMGQRKLMISPASGPLPIGAGMWVQAIGPTSLRVLDGEALHAEGVMMQGLTLIHRLFQQRLAQLDETDQREEQQRMASRQQVQRGLVRAAMADVRSILHPGSPTPQRETPLLSAMATIGASLGVKVQGPAKSEDMSLVKDPVEAIARASHIRHRRVLLTDTWWKSDCGPMLATLRETQQPIALIKRSLGRYIAVDPTNQATWPVNAQTAGQLATEATMFYRPLPASATRPWHLIPFARWNQAFDVSFVVVLSLIATLLGMLTPLATARIMDFGIPDANSRLVIELGLALAGAAFGIAMLEVAQGVLTVRIGTRAETATEAGVWDRLLKLRPKFFSQFSTGDLLTRASAVSDISREINGATLRSLLSSLMGLLNLGLLFYYSSKLALIAIILVFAIAAVTITCGVFIGRYSRQLLELRGHFFGMVVQMVGGVGKLRVAHAEPRAFAVWMTRYAEQLRLMFKAQRAEDGLTVFNHILPTASSIALFWFAATMLLAGDMAGGAAITIGIFLAFNTAMGIFIASATDLSLTIVGLVDTFINSRRVAPIFKAEPEVHDAAADPGRLTGQISLARVHFRYQADGPKILDGVDLIAEPGQFVALTGPSGCGKTTILRLLLGFETPESGAIAYDGQDMSGLDVNAVRRQIGVVLQSSRINTASIFDNIAGGMAISMEQAWEAAEDAGLADDIRDMPMGMHTMISEGGTNISGGQRQRLFIARALVKRPKILLLDEATSALDNRTQRIVSRSLARRNVTRIVIAHRLSTIENADRIYVFDRGRVVDEGTFDELKRTNELFSLTS